MSLCFNYLNVISWVTLNDKILNIISQEMFGFHIHCQFSEFNFTVFLHLVSLVGLEHPPKTSSVQQNIVAILFVDSFVPPRLMLLSFQGAG